MSRRRVAVLGGGIAGVTAAWQLAQRARAEGDVEAVLFEASARLGGTVETVLRDGFVIECGPDGWVTEKPWARQLVRELGLQEKLIESQDADRVTYILMGGRLLALPDGMRMMVPTDLAALDDSPLFGEEAKRAYAREPARVEELRRTAPESDESIAAFVERHFGGEVLAKIGAPLLSGIFGGDVANLSVRAVMPAFVRMERESGSLILAAQKSAARTAQTAVFTSLANGTEALINRMKAELLPDSVRLNTQVTSLVRDGDAWTVNGEGFDAVMMAVPAHVACSLLGGISPRMAELVTMEASSSTVVALAFAKSFELPQGFGFLVPKNEASSLLAATFVDQKYPARVPEGGRLLRAFFGEQLAGSDEDIAELALRELRAVLGALPEPAFAVVRHWPRSLPQYAVGHLERMAGLDGLVREWPGLWLLGNAYRGVGLPDLVRDARAAARAFLGD